MDLKARNEEIREFFNEKAVGYDDVHIPKMPAKVRIAQLLPDGVKKVLDLGAGTGLELFPLLERFPEARVKVVDISEEMLRELEKRPFADHLEIVCGDFFDEEFGSGFDAVISSAALHHFTPEDKARLYAKVFACLRPGGYFINSDRYMNTKEEEDEIFHLFRTDRQRWRHFDTPLAVCTEEKILGETGFVGAVCQDTGFEDYRVLLAVKPE